MYHKQLCDSNDAMYSLQNATTGEVTDMLSFYHLPSTVVNHPVHKTLKVAYLFLCFHTTVPLKDLVYDALVLAKKVCCLVLWSPVATACGFYFPCMLTTAKFPRTPRNFRDAWDIPSKGD